MKYRLFINAGVTIPLTASPTEPGANYNQFFIGTSIIARNNMDIITEPFSLKTGIADKTNIQLNNYYNILFTKAEYDTAGVIITVKLTV